MKKNNNISKNTLSLDALKHLLDETNKIDESVNISPLDSMRNNDDIEERFFNTSIYNGITPTFHATLECREAAEKRFEEYKRNFYGDLYDELNNHTPGDPKVATLLIDRAIKRNNGAILPKALINEYKLKFDII